MFPSSPGSGTFQGLLAGGNASLSSGTDPSSDFQPGALGAIPNPSLNGKQFLGVQSLEPSLALCCFCCELANPSPGGVPGCSLGSQLLPGHGKRLQEMPGRVSHESWEMQVPWKEQNHPRHLPWRSLGLLLGMSERKRLWKIPGRNLRSIQENTIPCQRTKSPGAASLEDSEVGFPPREFGMRLWGGCSRNGSTDRNSCREGWNAELPWQGEMELLLFQRLLSAVINFLLIPSFPQAEFHPPGAW